MKKLDKLILGSFLGPFLLTFLVVDFILLIVNMLKYFDEIFGKGLGFWIYAELIGYFVISISPMALPLAVLLSSLMTFGNLGEHFELTAIKSSGISLIRAMRPIGIFAIMLTIVAFLSNNYLVPKVNLKTFSLLYDIRMKSPALDIKEGVFYAGIPNYSIKVNQKLDDVRLKDIIIYNHAEQDGNLNVTLADSGRMETFFNDSYLKLTLYNGQNYKEARSTRGISEPPVEFSRTKFDENVIVFNLDAFQLSRTPEDLWSTNRAIKNINEIRLGLDSINTIVNDLKFQNFQTAESIYPFFTKNRKLTPPEEIKRRKQRDDELRRSRIEKESREKDSLVKVKIEQDSGQLKIIDSLNSRELNLAVASTTEAPKSDSLFERKLRRRFAIQDTVAEKPVLITSVDTTGKEEVKKVPRTAPLTVTEKQLLDSVIYKRGYISNAMTMALNNSRNLKNTFNVKMSQVDSHEREYRRYEIAWYQKYTQAIACFVMFLIGAPLGSIIKKGGLGMPVLISIIFFILFYMLTITGEKWAKEGVTDSLFGTVFSNLCLLPFGLFFLRQARKDARLFEADFYSGLWKKVSGFLAKSLAKSN
ncbi:YjgP/YjgQ family permease [Algoriphagus lacus]|uniref:YjgP/YjgQ family permease n=1 Tax=Algoriphagus lacus TaxID=2056311 RepID=A0A418PS32_9BACT|nr:LptF/LptG family permease [Algoriphagus lacus]RIW15681.1 YjgP/YjgQ family permease [Algoriphagus lacus]